MTKVESYSLILDVLRNNVAIDAIEQDDYEELISRISKDRDSAERKANSPSKPKVNASVEELKADILRVLSDAEPMSIPQIMAELGEYTCADGKPLTSQRVSSVLTQLGKGTKAKVGSDLVERTVVAKVAYFALKE